MRTAELSKDLAVSYETLRKDLDCLAKKGKLTRVHSGAVLPGTIDENPTKNAEKQYVDFQSRIESNVDAKHTIALKAIEFVSNGQSVALDSGTTSYELARLLKNNFTNLTIVTNSLKNAYELVPVPGFTVIATGGILTPDEHSFVSEFATLILEKINIDVMFLTSSGITLENGITDQRLGEVLIHNKMREISRKVITLADSSKFGKTSLYHVCGLDEVDAIITDASVGDELREAFQLQGHNLITT